MDLQDLRSNIDMIDEEILQLFIKRMSICEKVADYKIENNLPVFQKNREQNIINSIKKKVPEELANGAAALFYNIMDISKCIQQEQLFEDKPFMIASPLDLNAAENVGCFGLEGSNSNHAAKILFPNKKMYYYNEFEDIFKAVEKEDIDFGVLPIQNSTTGSVTQIYDLMKKYSFYISKVIRLEVSHCLAAKPGTDISDIKTVYSHPQALYQCSSYITKNKIKALPSQNTASATKLVSESDEPFGAICSKACAETYGLTVVSDKICNSYPNYTRFICISKDFYMSSDAKTISILITLPNIQGSLIRLLTKFFVNGLNLEKIESRPLAGGSFNVMFYLDFEGNINDKKVSAILNEMKNEFDTFKFLGNYSELL